MVFFIIKNDLYDLTQGPVYAYADNRVPVFLRPLQGLFSAASYVITHFLHSIYQEWSKICLLEYQLNYEKWHWLIATQTHFG